MGQRDAWGRAVVTLLSRESGLLLFVTPLQAHTTYFAKKFEERGQFSHYFFSHLEGEWERYPNILFKLQEKLNKTLKLG